MRSLVARSWIRPLLTLWLLSAVSHRAHAAAARLDLPPHEVPETRTFQVHYKARVIGIPEGTRTLRVWVPVPQDSDTQEIRVLTFSRPPRLTTGETYGNRFAYWEVPTPKTTELFEMAFNCTRRAVHVDPRRVPASGADDRGEFEVFRKPNRLVLVDDRIRALSERITGGARTPADKARAIYEYVLAHMRYDKTGTGWGRGSTAFACDEGRGNCTDFHSLFISLCRAQGIPAAFRIGLAIPDAAQGEALGGYHCWAYFRLPGAGWAPVDCSEAWLNRAKADFYFGGLTDSRVAFATGRDLILEPAQAGPPLNYFIDPYAEADGHPIQATKAWSYTDIDPNGDSPVQPQ